MQKEQQKEQKKPEPRPLVKKEPLEGSTTVKQVAPNHPDVVTKKTPTRKKKSGESGAEKDSEEKDTTKDTKDTTKEKETTTTVTVTEKESSSKEADGDGGLSSSTSATGKTGIDYDKCDKSDKHDENDGNDEKNDKCEGTNTNTNTISTTSGTTSGTSTTSGTTSGPTTPTTYLSWWSTTRSKARASNEEWLVEEAKRFFKENPLERKKVLETATNLAKELDSLAIRILVRGAQIWGSQIQIGSSKRDDRHDAEGQGEGEEIASSSRGGNGKEDSDKDTDDIEDSDTILRVYEVYIQTEFRLRNLESILEIWKVLCDNSAKEVLVKRLSPKSLRAVLETTVAFSKFEDAFLCFQALTPTEGEGHGNTTTAGVGVPKYVIQNLVSLALRAGRVQDVLHILSTTSSTTTTAGTDTADSTGTATEGTEGREGEVKQKAQGEAPEAAGVSAAVSQAQCQQVEGAAVGGEEEVLGKERGTSGTSTDTSKGLSTQSADAAGNAAVALVVPAVITYI